MFKKVGVFLVFTMLAVHAGPAVHDTAAAKVVDRIVAIVNEDIIRLSDLNRELEPVKQRIRASGLTPEQQAEEIYEIRKQLLDDLIDEKLVDQVINELGLRAGESEVDATIERIKASNRMTQEDLQEALSARGISMDDYRSDIRQQILRNQLINREIKSRIVVTEDDIREYYEANPEKYGLTGKYKLRNIFMLFGDDRYEVRREMEAVLEALDDGADFAEMAEKHSMAPNAADGGRLGTFALEDLSEHLQPEMAALEPGEYTGIVETELGFQIFLLEDLEAPEEQEMEDARQQIEQQMYEQKVEEKFDEWLKSLRGSAHIRIIL